MVTRKKQLQLNVEEILDEYYNGMYDYPEDYPKMTIKECREYVLDQVYDIESNGNGYMRFKKGICDDLKFLGNDYIYNVIDTYAKDSGIIKED